MNGIEQLIAIIWCSLLFFIAVIFNISHKKNDDTEDQRGEGEDW